MRKYCFPNKITRQLGRPRSPATSFFEPPPPPGKIPTVPIYYLEKPPPI